MRQFVRSWVEVEDTGDDHLPVELFTLHLPVDPVPTRPCPMSDLHMPTQASPSMATHVDCFLLLV